MQALLTDALEGGPADLVLRYHIGNPATDETGLELRGDGGYDAFSTATAGGQRRSYSGAIPAEDVRALLATLAGARVWEARHVKRHQPKGDVSATISVSRGGREEEVRLWASEIADVPAFDAAQAAILALIRRVSGGEVLEPGR